MENTSLLLVEGKNEEYVIKQLCDHCRVETDFRIESADGIDNLKIALKTKIKNTNIYKKIWVIVDADNDFNAAWQSIRNILLAQKKYNITPQTLFPSNGIILEPHDAYDITIGVWIMPNNTDIGMLEDFLINLIPTKNKLLLKSTEVVEELEMRRGDYPGLYKPNHKPKARIQTWLSWQDKPGISIKVALRDQLFATDAELCVRFNNWLTNLNN